MKTMGIALSLIVASMAGSAYAKDFPYHKHATLKVGQSIILKGVRGNCEDTTAPTWARIRGRLPKSKTGKFSDGGAGTVRSDSCGKRVVARGVRFTATTKGRENLVIYNDGSRITVK